MSAKRLRSRSGTSQRPLGCEMLEPRQLLSVAVMPRPVNVHSVNHGNGVVTVAVLSDQTVDPSTIDPTSLMLTATPDGRQLQLRGTAKLEDVNGDGVADMILKFRRSELRGLLPMGQAAIDVAIGVQGTSTVNGQPSSVTDFGSDTITIFQPGRGHGRGH